MSERSRRGVSFLSRTILIWYFTGSLFGGGPLYVWEGRPVVWPGPVTYRADRGPLGQLTNAEAIELVRSVFDLWEAVPTSSISFLEGSQLSQDVGSSNFSTLNSAENPIVFDGNGELTDRLFGYGASWSVLGFSSPETEEGSLVGSWTVINGRQVQRGALDAVRAVMTHEFGHLIGLHHSQVNLAEAFDGDPENDVLVPVMFPLILEGSLGGIRADDAAWVSYLYPSAEFAATTATLSGQVFRAHWGALTGANLQATPLDPEGDPILSGAVSSVSGFLLEDDGAYLIPGLSGGEYLLSMEPIFPFGEILGPGSDVGPPDKFYDFEEEYYNGSREGSILTDPPWEREVLSLVAGTETRGVDLVSNEWKNNTFLYQLDNDCRTFVFPPDFWFPFFGRYYNAVAISLNGFVTFRSDPHWALPQEGRLRGEEPIIAPFFCDFDPHIGGSASVEFTEDSVEILWDSMALYGSSKGGETNSFRLILKRNGEIRIEYLDIAPDAGKPGHSVIVGLGPGELPAAQEVVWSAVGEVPVDLTGVALYQAFREGGVDLEGRQLAFTPAPADSGLAAEPNLFQVCDGKANVASTIHWWTPQTDVEVRLQSPIGKLVSSGRAEGTIETGPWVTHGMNFLLVDRHDRRVFGVDTVRMTTEGCGIVFRAQDNPVRVCDGRSHVPVRLEWEAPAVERVEIRVGAPDGWLLTSGVSSGSFETGDWVREGLKFYLVNPDNHGVLASETIGFTWQGCPRRPVPARNPR